MKKVKVLHVHMYNSNNDRRKNKEINDDVDGDGVYHHWYTKAQSCDTTRTAI